MHAYIELHEVKGGRSFDETAVTITDKIIRVGWLKITNVGGVIVITMYRNVITNA